MPAGCGWASSSRSLRSAHRWNTLVESHPSVTYAHVPPCLAGAWRVSWPCARCVAAFPPLWLLLACRSGKRHRVRHSCSATLDVRPVRWLALAWTVGLPRLCSVYSHKCPAPPRAPLCLVLALSVSPSLSSAAGWWSLLPLCVATAQSGYRPTPPPPFPPPPLVSDKPAD